MIVFIYKLLKKGAFGSFAFEHLFTTPSMKASPMLFDFTMTTWMTDSRQQLTSLSVLFDDVEQGAKNIEFRGCTWAQIGKPNHNSPNPFLCKPGPDLYPDKLRTSKRRGKTRLVSCLVLSCLVLWVSTTACIRRERRELVWQRSRQRDCRWRFSQDGRLWRRVGGPAA